MKQTIFKRNCYTYLIGWKELDLWYYGVKYGKDADPNEFWKSYFTSSETVHKFIVNHGQPNVIEIRKLFGDNPKKAIKWESTALRRLNVPGNKKFLNGHCAGGGYNASLQSSKVGKNMIICKHKNTGEHKRLSKFSEEWLSGDYVGINSGIKCSESTKIAASKTHKGVPKTKEQIKKIGDSHKNSLWIHNFNTKETKRLTKGITKIPDGFIRVCGPHLLITLEEKLLRKENLKIIAKENRLKNKQQSKRNNSDAQKKFNKENPLNRMIEADYMLIEKIFGAYKDFPKVPDKNSAGKIISYNRSFANVYMHILNCSHHRIFSIIENRNPFITEALKKLNRFAPYLGVLNFISDPQKPESDRNQTL